MLHPIFSVLISRPELVMEHVAGYAALVRDEASTVSGEVAQRAIAWGVAVLCFIVFLVLAGVAAMLGAVYGDFHWVFLVVPGTALLLGVIAWTVARRRLPQKAFTELRSQLGADAQALRDLGARK